ncbi:MAG TPA: branched-chain amino acid ABC transporter permease [Devosiaceae bacterium]
MLTILALGTDALAYAMALFIVCVGLSVTLGLMRIANLAHGAFAMIGGYAASHLTTDAGFGFLPALLVAILVTVAAALPIERFLYRRIYGAPQLTQVLMTIGMTFVIVGTVNFVFGPTLKSIVLPELLSGPVDIGFRSIAGHKLLAIGCGAVVALGLWVLFNHTRLGLCLRATVADAQMTGHLGVHTASINAVGFVLGVGLAALGGVVGAQLMPVEPYYALRYLMTFLVVVSMGGAGSIGGTLAACLLLATLSTFTQYMFPDFGDLFLYLAVILVVVAMPRGLLGWRRA